MGRSKLKEILNRFKNLKILVVGDVILDRYLYGKVDRISPEAPVPVLEVEREEVRLGGAGNVAHNLSALGVDAHLFGVVGKDDAAEKLKGLLREKGINSLLIEEDRPTTQKTRVVSMSQQLLRIDREDKKPVGEGIGSRLRNTLKESAFNGVIVSDYAKGVITSEVMDTLINSGLFVSIDPRPVNKLLYRGANLITPNEKELLAMSGGRERSVEELGRRLKSELEVETLVVTRGAKGMSLFNEDEVKLFPAKAKKVYDVTGAGDTVIAVLTCAFLSGASWDLACELGNVAAGIVVGEFGTAVASPERILQEVNE